MIKAKGKITAVRILAAIGLAFALVSLIHYINLAFGLNQQASFCNINATFNCDAVNQSKWSTFLGTPLAAYGGAFYLFIFSLTYLKGNTLWIRVLTAFTFLACLASLYLFYVSEFLIGSLCILCMGMYLVNFLLFFFVLSLRKYSESSGKPAKELKANWARLLIISLFCLMFLFNITRVSAAYLVRTNDFYLAWAALPVDKLDINEGDLLHKDYIKGPDDAPITIVEYSDLECSACRRFYLEFEEMLPKYEKKIKLVFKNFPLDKSCNQLLERDMHFNACYAAEFARCAGEQGKFWQALDYIYRLDYSTYAFNKNLIKDALDQSYSFLGLDKDAILECLNSDRQLKKVESDLSEGRAFGLHGTPSIWVNGRKISFTSLDAMKNIFNGILQQ
jgi:uncharacterized membrane protein/protein-disulfide isomerase